MRLAARVSVHEHANRDEQHSIVPRGRWIDAMIDWIADGIC